MAQTLRHPGKRRDLIDPFSVVIEKPGLQLSVIPGKIADNAACTLQFLPQQTAAFSIFQQGIC